MLRRLVLAGLAALLMAACTSDDEPSSTPTTFPSFDTTTTALPMTPVIGRALSPERGSVQGTGGRGMVVALTFTARDASVLPAELRTAPTSPAAAAARPGKNPAFPGLVVGLSTTSAALGGPSANLANLFQIVSPALQLDGSMQVSVVWANDQPEFGSGVDANLIAYVVAGGAAPDVIPETQANIDVISNPVEVNFRVSGTADAAAAAPGDATTPSTTIRGATTTSARPATATTGAPATVVPVVTTRPAPATTRAPATTTAT